MGGMFIFLLLAGGAVAILLWELLCWLIRHVRIEWVS